MTTYIRNQDGQPENIAFNYYANRSKALCSLIGIIDGILADSKVTESEVNFLDTWISSNDVLFRNRLMREIKDRVDAICLKDQVLCADLQDIRNSAEYLILNDYSINIIYGDDDGKEILLGICKGITSEQNLNDDEIQFLVDFFERNNHLQYSWPSSELYVLIQDIIQEGVITEHERGLLLQFINSIFGDSISRGISDGLSISLPLDHGAQIMFPDHTFCLTGAFLHGKRDSCEELILERGGRVSNTISKKVQFLVIGTLSSRDWKFSNYGRKIETAVEYRDIKRYDIKIVSEEMWLSAL